MRITHCDDEIIEKPKPEEKTMSDYKSRLTEEKKELDSKLVKLEAFLKTKAYKDLNGQKRWALVKQCGLMSEYSDVLEIRMNQD